MQGFLSALILGAFFGVAGMVIALLQWLMRRRIGGGKPQGTRAEFLYDLELYVRSFFRKRD